MRQTICDRTKAHVEISAPGKISAPAKLPHLSKPLCLSKVRRKSSAPSYYLGSAESPTADFLQIQRALVQILADSVASRSCRPQVI